MKHVFVLKWELSHAFTNEMKHAFDLKWGTPQPFACWKEFAFWKFNLKHIHKIVQIIIKKCA